MNKKVLVGFIILIVLILGTTYAWWTWNSTTNTDVSLTVDGVTVTYDGGPDITGINLIPVSSKEKGVADNTAILKTVTVSSSQTLYMDLNLTLETLPDGLKASSFVWELYNGTTKVSNGNFGNANEGDVIKLAKSRKVTSTTTTYNLYIWIDGNKTNSNNMMNQTFKFILNANGTDEIPKLDTSGANEPNTSNGLIPVMYDGTKWVKADSSNSNIEYQWYNYDNKQWANAVAVTNTNRDTYKTAEAGTPIPEEDVLAYYVWIPRYKYKVWNITKTIGTDSNYTRFTGIDIIFESGTDSTGNISCTYDFTVTDGSLSEKCNGKNGDYYTHPAFWWDTNGNSTREANEELTGIWVGKFEISSTTPDATDGGGTTTDLAVRTKPNTISWRSNSVSNFSAVIQAISASGNEYGIATNAESHMLKNMEWGAVAYFTHSKYGICTGSGCSVISTNSNIYTGGNNYVSNVAQSTTGNIYGIYDMKGGAYEYVMGNVTHTSGSYTYHDSGAGSNFSYSTTTAKYVDTYAFGTSKTDQTAYNRARLGDATGEVVLSSGKGWNNDTAQFANSSGPWFMRGGMYGSNEGVFRFANFNGSNLNTVSARVALLAF